MKGFTSANFLFIAYSINATFPPKYHDNYSSYARLQALYHIVRARELHSSHGIRIQCVYKCSSISFSGVWFISFRSGTAGFLVPWGKLSQSPPVREIIKFTIITVFFFSFFFFTVVPCCILILSKFRYQLMHKRNALKGVLEFTLKMLQHVSVYSPSSGSVPFELAKVTVVKTVN